MSKRLKVKNVEWKKCYFFKEIFQYLQINTQNLSFNEEKWQPESEKQHLNI